jgi:hypothetical protein
MFTVRAVGLLRRQGDCGASDGREKSSHAEHHIDRRRLWEASKGAVILVIFAARASRRFPSSVVLKASFVSTSSHAAPCSQLRDKAEYR